ncbi:LOW QUALITY PROTEIN: protein IMPACT-like [Sceloporus undulatus]|uniref:LOW QUALITY PROTEIN: protein IMPACT-like n=1 Tax=Sceloporus undulatus TaxID=8520 RepID=UPI001C4CB1E0|nr:LOW QUALITY PROTEIN: protein IMPACT-like [Sceloporus undulatus]
MVLQILQDEAIFECMYTSKAFDPEAEQKRIEEIEALSAIIYDDEWYAIDVDEKIFCIRVSECLEEPKWTLCLQVILPPDYPTAAPPIYQLNAPWLQGQEYAELANNLEEIYIQNLGESILYLWVEKIREFLIEKSHQSCDSGPDVKKSMEETDVEHEETLLDYLPLQECTTSTLNFYLSERQEGEELPPIYYGNRITDRRSTFQGRLAPVVSPKQKITNKGQVQHHWA